MAKKDIDTQIKKNGKLAECYICLPDPKDVYTWYYVIWGFENQYQNGYYFGKVTCPQDYPAKAPTITLLTHNGRFTLQTDGICLSISNHHPESWNPAWKVNQQVLGLQTFWHGGEGTYGSMYSYDFRREFRNYNLTEKEKSIKWARDSRENVLNQPKFKEIFAQYADVIGINDPVEMPSWD